MDISSLPGRGSTFRASTGAGSFKRKFTGAVRHGSLRNLEDNTDGVLKTVKKYERVIRMGAFDRKRQMGAMKMVKSIEGSKLTKGDKIKIKKIFQHLAAGPTTQVAKSKVRAEIEEVPIVKPKTRLVAPMQNRAKLTEQGRLNTGLSNQTPTGASRLGPNQSFNQDRATAGGVTNTGLANQNGGNTDRLSINQSPSFR